MKFIQKINNVVVEAPVTKTMPNGATVINYNSPNNAENLLADGYIEYDGNHPLAYLDIVDGQVIELQYPPVDEIRERLVNSLYDLKCGVAYQGLILRDDEHDYTFETNTDSITLINSTLVAAQDDSTQLQWKVYENGEATFYPLTIGQLKVLFAFGMTVINTAFATESALLAEVHEMTEEQLADNAYVEAFEAKARQQFGAINKIFDATNL